MAKLFSILLVLTFLLPMLSDRTYGQLSRLIHPSHRPLKRPEGSLQEQLSKLVPQDFLENEQFKKLFDNALQQQELIEELQLERRKDALKSFIEQTPLKNWLPKDDERQPEGPTEYGSNPTDNSDSRYAPGPNNSNFPPGEFLQNQANRMQENGFNDFLNPNAPTQIDEPIAANDANSSFDLDSGFLKSAAENDLSKAVFDSLLEAVDESTGDLMGAFADPSRLQDWGSWQRDLTRSFNSWNRGFERASRNLIPSGSLDFGSDSFAFNMDLSDSKPMIAFFLVSAVLVVGFIAWHKANQQEPINDQEFITEAIADPSKIRNSATLVSVFNLLLKNVFGGESSFWNHRKAMKQLATNTSVSTSDLEKLSKTYEKARYDESQTTSSDSLNHARRTLRAVQQEVMGAE